MPNLIMSNERVQSLALYDIDLLLRKNGKSISDFATLPVIDVDLQQQCNNRLLYEETMYNRSSLASESASYINMLNEKQREVFEAVLESVEKEEGEIFFVYGHGGTGKTFLWKTIIAKLRSDGKIVLPVASSGIASLLVEGGRTAHSRFRIPLKINENSSCDIKHNTMLSELICLTNLVIWDEAPMNHKFVFEAVDRSFRDILRKIDPDSMNKPFGGKTILLGGDFRQILPVIPKKGREEIVMSSINRSYLWESCKVIKLEENMRIEPNVPHVTIADRTVDFRDWVLNIGDGKEPSTSLIEDEPNWIQIPNEVLVPAGDNGVETIVREIYTNIQYEVNDAQYVRDRAILTPRNEDVDSINNYVLKYLPTESMVYHSSDTICKSSANFEAQETMYPVEFLNSLKFNGIPNHELHLKIGSPIMLLRNINPSKGLCNGTRLIVTQLAKWVIEGIVITGNNIGEKVFIPRINMTPTDASLPFTFKRKQFPVALCYAMTINKSQGQTLRNVGLYLPQPVFSHRQFYVAISRVTSPTGLKVLCQEESHPEKGFTKNVVYHEVFNNL